MQTGFRPRPPAHGPTARTLLISLLLGTAPALAGPDPAPAATKPVERPNFIVVLCDNLGYGDIEPFGSTLQRTPHLNRMAREGRRFTDFCVTAGVCTPSRASLMTGCYAQRVGMHRNPRDGQVLRPLSPYGLNPDEVTIAEVLKQRGYATAIIGKWHLGDRPEFLPTRQGFDLFFGIPYSDDMTQEVGRRLGDRLDGAHWPPLPLMENETVVEAPANRHQLTRRYTERAVAFIRQNRDRPFFLYLPQAMPGSTTKPFASDAFRGKSRNGPWGDAVEELDWSTGQILDELVTLGIDRRTLVVWTSDNGAPMAKDGNSQARGTNRPLFGRGYTTAEGGFRVPTLMWWPGRVPADTVCRELTTTMDLLPTFAHLAGAQPPTDRVLDGHDIRPLIFAEADAETPYEAFYYYNMDQLQAVRSGPWKLFLPLAKFARHPHFKQGEPPRPLLFHLEHDIGSTTDVAQQHADVVDRLTQLAEVARETLGDAGRAGSQQRPAGRLDAEQEQAQADPDGTGNRSRPGAKAPNVVVIMTDNQGEWTLGCYGNRDIRTPNIDRLAAAGMRFTRAFASNPVCSPTRATFLTGLVPSQHGVHCFLRAGHLQVGPEARCTLADFTSLPEVLHAAGYNCGLVGKWHLGGNLTPQEGFTDYWITMPHGATSTFYGGQVIEHGEIRTEPRYLTDLWTEHALEFIDQNKAGPQPFFLFLAYNGPYALGASLTRPGHNRHAAYYADKPLPSFPREPVHPWQYNNRDFINNPVSIRRVATEVSGIDDGVGAIMAALRQHGLDENTIVVFTADQGWVGGHGGFFGMGDHTRPLTARDGMMRIPMIWRQPGRIPAGKTSADMVANYDFMPTLLSYLGLGDKMPSKPPSPGRDFAATLGGETAAAWDDTVYYEFENLRCIRTERWKYVHRFPNGPHELYDLASDAAERTNLLDDPDHAAIRAQLKDRLDRFYARYAEPKYDLWRGGGAQTALLRGVGAALPQPKSVEPPPPPASFRPADLKVPDGYTVELVAGPPLVKYPMLGCLDDDGRLFIAESAGLNLNAKQLGEQKPSSIRMLTDTDGDGRFDRATTFADKMTFPQGVLYHEGALLVASPPNIWRLEDTDGDGVADRREKLVSQFGYTGNAASIHGCFLGPCGRIYWCDGRHGHEFRDTGGQITSKLAGSYIFSCRPDGTDVRIHCGGGMDNPVEIDFTDTGEMLGTVNILYSRPRVDCLVHWLYGGAYPHYERVLGERKRTGALLGPVHRFGHVAVSGMTRYRSGVLERSFRGNVFAALFNSGKVVRVELARSGSTFAATQREFLSSRTHDFRPTDVLEDADGSLLVIDTGGWFHLGCPTSQIAKPEILGGIYRVRRRGMTPQVDPWGRQIAWSQIGNAQLISLLSDTRPKVRARAITECAGRGGAIVRALAGAVRRGDSRRRRNVVWALARIVGQVSRSALPEPVAGRLVSTGAAETQASQRPGTARSTAVAEARAALRLALTDRDSSVRLAACHAIAINPDAEALDALLERLRTDQPASRREAAKALGRIGNARAVPALLAAMDRGVDRTEEHALIYALIEINDPEATRRGLAEPVANVRRGALIALDQMDSGNVQAADAVPLLEAPDEPLRSAALDIVRRHPDWAGQVLPLLQRWLTEPEAALERPALVADLTTALVADPAVAALVGRTLAAASTPVAIRLLLLRALAAGRALPLDESWVEPLERLLEVDQPQTLALTLAAVTAIKTDRFNGKLDEIAADAARPPLDRVAALEAISGRGRLQEATFALLTMMLGQNGPPVARAQAARIVGASSLSPAQLLRLAPLLEQAGPLELRDLIRPFRGTSDAEIARPLLASIEKSRGLFSLPPIELSNTVNHFPAELLPAANRLLDRLKQQDEQKQERLDQLLPILKRGDAARGRACFGSDKAKCTICHRVRDEGGKIGPDLSTIGSIRDSHALLEAIVYPSASFVREFEPYMVLTEDGRVFSGLIARETEQTVYLQQQVGEPVAIDRDDIEIIAPGTVSIMPQGLDQTLSEQELADVIAYLRTLK